VVIIKLLNISFVGIKIWEIECIPMQCCASSMLRMCTWSHGGFSVGNCFHKRCWDLFLAWLRNPQLIQLELNQLDRVHVEGIKHVTAMTPKTGETHSFLVGKTMVHLVWWRGRNFVIHYCIVATKKGQILML
jgi:hypothetical protein